MAQDVIIRGHSTGAGVEVNAANQIMVVPEVDAYTNPGNVGTIRVFGENDGEEAILLLL